MIKEEPENAKFHTVLLRNIPSEVYDKVKAESKATKISMRVILLQILKKGMAQYDFHV